MQSRWFLQPDGVVLPGFVAEEAAGADEVLLGHQYSVDCLGSIAVAVLAVVAQLVIVKPSELCQNFLAVAVAAGIVTVMSAAAVAIAVAVRLAAVAVAVVERLAAVAVVERLAAVAVAVAAVAFAVVVVSLAAGVAVLELASDATY